MGFLDKAKEKIADAQENIASLSIDEQVKQKTTEVLKAINELVPVLRKNGYAIRSVKVEIGIPPKIMLSLDRINASTELLEDILKEVDGDKIKTGIVKSLITINKMQDTFRKSRFEIGGLDIKLTFPPSVGIKLVPFSADQCPPELTMGMER